jgi:hypothetical protein
MGVGVRAHTGAIAASPYRQMGLTHGLTRAEAGLAQLQSRLQLPQNGSMQLLIIDEEQTLREVMEWLVRVGGFSSSANRSSRWRT